MNTPTDPPRERRVIKRYSNRKLYDTRDSTYVTLLQIAKMVREGEDVLIIDNTTKEDKTEVTLALAISEELRAKQRSVPLATLRSLIQERGGKILTSLREGPIGRLIPDEGEDAKDTKNTAAEAATQEASPASDATDREKPTKERADRPSFADFVASSKNTLDQWQHAIDERVRTVLPNVALFLDVQAELRRLGQRVAQLEQQLQQTAHTPPSEPRGLDARRNPPGEKLPTEE